METCIDERHTVPDRRTTAIHAAPRPAGRVDQSLRPRIRRKPRGGRHGSNWPVPRPRRPRPVRLATRLRGHATPRRCTRPLLRRPHLEDAPQRSQRHDDRLRQRAAAAAGHGTYRLPGAHSHAPPGRPLSTAAVTYFGHALLPRPPVRSGVHGLLRPPDPPSARRDRRHAAGMPTERTRRQLLPRAARARWRERLRVVRAISRPGRSRQPPRPGGALGTLAGPSPTSAVDDGRQPSAAVTTGPDSQVLAALRQARATTRATVRSRSASQSLAGPPRLMRR